MAGRIYFDGADNEPADFGSSFAAALVGAGNKRLPQLYPHFSPTQVLPGELASKTQMFTERYMVDWLLQNSLGPLWLAMCQKHGSGHFLVVAFDLLVLLEQQAALVRAERLAGLLEPADHPAGAAEVEGQVVDPVVRADDPEDAPVDACSAASSACPIFSRLPK